MPSMKKLVTNVTGTVRTGPATGYIAKVLGCHHQLLPFNDAAQSFCRISWIVWYCWAKDNALHHLGFSFPCNKLQMVWWLNGEIQYSLPLCHLQLHVHVHFFGLFSKYWPYHLRIFNIRIFIYISYLMFDIRTHSVKWNMHVATRATSTTLTKPKPARGRPAAKGTWTKTG